LPLQYQDYPKTKCIQRLAKQGVFLKKIHAARDVTLFETTSKYKGCGPVAYKRKVTVRGIVKTASSKK